MPTGYTSKIYEGEPQTFEEFAMDCARAMGIAVYQRDDGPGPVKKIRNDGHDLLESRMKAYQSRLERLIVMSPAEIQAGFDEYWNDAISRYNEALEKNNALRNRYQDMLKSVRAWEPPAGLTGLKDFMIEQLEGSIHFDCGDASFFLPRYHSPQEWHDAEVKETERLVDSYGEDLACTKRRIGEQNALVDALYKSLGLEYHD